jgi:hypothetical protein
MQRLTLPDGELRVWEPDSHVTDIGRMYVLDLLGVCLLIREREDGVYVHLDRDSDTATDPERDVIIEFDNGGETVHPAAERD